MTAEIAIINRQAIALAADSAVTIGKERVWKYSNKLFSLGPNNDIAIMIYGAGEFVGFPWETVVKTFRVEMCSGPFSTVADCADKFALFLHDQRFKADDLNATLHLSLIVDQIEHLARDVPECQGEIEFRKALKSLCDERLQTLEQIAEIAGRPSYKRFTEEYSVDTIKSFAVETFKRVIPSKTAKVIHRFLYEYMTREVRSRYASGVVVAGYGKSEFFPCVHEFAVDGKDGLLLRIWKAQIQDLNKADRRKTMIIPFAQADIFHLFMEGISPEYIQYLNMTLENVLNDKSTMMIKDYVGTRDDRIVETARQRLDNRVVIEQFTKEFRSYRHKTIVQPILDVVRALPKEEMAEMALALVELTSLRRKVDSPVESVGGPVDVAVISKGDGMVWIRRKHYFDLDNNTDYLYRKNLLRGGDHG